MKMLKHELRSRFLQLREGFVSRDISPAQYAIDLDELVRRYLAIWLPGDKPYPGQVWAGRNSGSAGRRIRIDRFSDGYAGYTLLAGKFTSPSRGQVSEKTLRANYEPEAPDA